MATTLGIASADESKANLVPTQQLGEDESPVNEVKGKRYIHVAMVCTVVGTSWLCSVFRDSSILGRF